MASLSVTQFFTLPRWNSRSLTLGSVSFIRIPDNGVHTKWVFSATSRNSIVASLQEEATEKNSGKERAKKPKRAGSRGKKKASSRTQEDNSEPVARDASVQEEAHTPELPAEGAPRPKRRYTKKAVSTSAVSTSNSVVEEKTEKRPTRRGRKKKAISLGDQGSDAETSDVEGVTFSATDDEDGDLDLQLGKYEDDDVSSTYGWPPLVCCFGAAQHAFVPSGRPANRLLDYEIHKSLKDALWEPEKYVRAPGGCAGSVAIALASLGGRVAFMGKLGDDEYGQSMLYYLNVNNVQTRSVRVDGKRSTALSQMKIGKRGSLRMTSARPCAEDCLSKAEINIDVLREARTFYFTTSSLLERNTRKTTLYAIKIAKKLGGVIFYDLNLPLPLWQSDEETRVFIKEVWKMADVVEVTKQELEFLCGITPSEEFDTKNNKRSKFVHYEPDVVAPLWHENLKVLFVTNGTSKIHYYTKDQDGFVLGMEDAPITPFTHDMSASGDGIVAALMRMLTVQPHLITDKGYLEHSIKYAIDCGVIDQWLLGRQRGFPPKEGMEEVAPDPFGIKSLTEREYRTVVPVSVS